MDICYHPWLHSSMTLNCDLISHDIWNIMRMLKISWVFHIGERVNVTMSFRVECFLTFNHLLILPQPRHDSFCIVMHLTDKCLLLIHTTHLKFVDFNLSHFLQFGQSLHTAFDLLQMEIILERYTSITQFLFDKSNSSEYVEDSTKLVRNFLSIPLLTHNN